MSEKMTPMPFKKLMAWINEEFNKSGTVFGVSPFIRKYDKHLNIFGEKINGYGLINNYNVDYGE